jgi:hypothetical protein
MKQGSNQGLRFMWFNEYKQKVTNNGEIQLTPLMGLLGGMSAGCFSTLGNNPFDVVKASLGSVLLTSNMNFLFSDEFIHTIMQRTVRAFLTSASSFPLSFTVAELCDYRHKMKL